MRCDRLLRPHQRPWLHPAVYVPRKQQVQSAKRALEQRASRHGFAEAILTFGGDIGFHTECRLVRTRLGDWSYELDCHETPVQSILIHEAEVADLYRMIHDLYAKAGADEAGMTRGNDTSGRLPILWYQDIVGRLVWFERSVPLQELVLNLLMDIHRRLEVPFPRL